MSLTGTWDTSVLQSKLGSLKDALQVDGRLIVEDETARLSRALCNVAAPWQPGGGNLERLGIRSVEREIQNLASEAKPELISEVAAKWGLKDINGCVTGTDHVKLPLEWANLDTSGQDLPTLHQRYRDWKGKVPLVPSPLGHWKSRVVVPAGTRAAYLERRRQHVGRWKASWGYAAYRLGSTRFNQWIKRHFMLLGSYAVFRPEGLRDPVRPSITFGSRVAGNYRSDFHNRVQFTVKARVRAIARRIEKAAQGYQADLATQMKTQAQARKSHEPEEIIR
jgi:hypothetical protein